MPHPRSYKFQMCQGTFIKKVSRQQKCILRLITRRPSYLHYQIELLYKNDTDWFHLPNAKCFKAGRKALWGRLVRGFDRHCLVITSHCGRGGRQWQLWPLYLLGRPGMCRPLGVWRASQKAFMTVARRGAGIYCSPPKKGKKSKSWSVLEGPLTPAGRPEQIHCHCFLSCMTLPYKISHKEGKKNFLCFVRTAKRTCLLHWAAGFLILYTVLALWWRQN